MSEPLLTKDAINLGGHKFPIALVGGIAAILGVLLILRSRKSGGQVAVGAANTGVNPAIDYTGGSLQPDYSAALANISAQLTSMGQPQAASPAAAPPEVMVGSSGAQFPLFGADNQVAAWVPGGTQLQVAGTAAPGGGLPVSYYGRTLYADIVDRGSIVTPVTLPTQPHI